MRLNTDGKKIQELPFRVEGDLHYHELLQEVAEPASTWQSLRHFAATEAKIRIGDQEFPNQLAEGHTLVQADLGPHGLVLFPREGNLTREELDLIRVPGDSAVLHRLLPPQDVAIGESWILTPEVLTAFLQLDGVSDHDVQGTLKKLDGSRAEIELSGKVTGAVNGIATQIELQGKLNFDRAAQCVSWLALSIQEQRAIGHAEPGFDVTARIRVAVAPLPASPPLAAASAAPVDTDRQLASLLHLHSSRGGFSLLHDRGWHVLTDRHDVTILRLVDRGDLIAQCNISKLPPADAKKPLTLELFQEEVKKALNTSFGQTVEASEVQNGNGIRILRVVAGGVTAELPIVWIYYHLANDAGRQAAFVISMEAKYLERFAQLDQRLLESFQFETPEEPVPAPASQEAQRAPAKARR